MQVGDCLVDFCGARQVGLALALIDGIRSEGHSSPLIGRSTTEAPILWRAQKSSISSMSFLPPVLDVVMLCMVNPVHPKKTGLSDALALTRTLGQGRPIVKTSAVIGGHMPTKHMVPRGRSSVKNLEKSTVCCRGHGGVWRGKGKGEGGSKPVWQASQE